MPTVPCDLQAESDVIASMLISRPAALAAQEIVQAADFYKPMHGNIFAAITDLLDHGEAINTTTVQSRLIEMGSPLQDPSILITYQSELASAAPVREYARSVQRTAAARELIMRCNQSVRDLMDGGDPYSEADELANQITSLGAASGEIESVTFETLLQQADEAEEWVIPQLFTRDSVVLLIGEEGLGKATVLRTMAMSAAQGLHPFKHDPIPPVRTWYGDFENPLKNIVTPAAWLHRTLQAQIQARTGHPYDPERFAYWRKPGGIDILSQRDRAQADREIAFHRPDVIFVGPLSRLYRKPFGASTYEDTADAVIDVLQRWKTKFNAAVVVEHHAPKARENGRRLLTPMGSQRFMGSPDLGITISADENNPQLLRVGRFRHDRYETDWPGFLRRSPDWVFDGGEFTGRVDDGR